ncbi:MAG: hypothetical protein VB934_20890, partial [Polyangiaceae bacterium]
MSQSTQVSPTDDVDADVLKDQTIAAQLIMGCNAALRIFRIHQEQNAAVEQPLKTVNAALGDLFERHDRVVLAYVEGVFYFGDVRLRFSTAQQLIADQLAKELSLRQIGGLRFDSHPPRDQIVSCFRVLSEAGKHAQPNVEMIRDAMRDAMVSEIRVLSVLKPVTRRDGQAVVKQTKRAAEIYKAAVAHAAGFRSAASNARKGAGERHGQYRASARTKRIVHELVDMSQRDAGVLLALAGLRGTGADDAEHSVAVAILAIALGKRLGLDKRLLADVGVAAVHHDEGLAALGPSEQDDDQKHPIIGLRALLGGAAWNDRLLRQVIVTYEHHRDYAPEGGAFGEAFVGCVYPLSQIVRLANDFDGLTRGRRGMAELDVAEAIAKMEEGAGSLYHPGLFDVFADMIVGVASDEVDEEDVAAARSGLDSMLAAFIDGGARDEDSAPPHEAPVASVSAAPSPEPAAQPRPRKRR